MESLNALFILQDLKYVDGGRWESLHVIPDVKVIIKNLRNKKSYSLNALNFSLLGIFLIQDTNMHKLLSKSKYHADWRFVINWFDGRVKKLEMVSSV